MDRELLAASLRVLTSSFDGKRLAAEDVDLLRAHATSQELGYAVEDLARSVAQRIIAANQGNVSGLPGSEDRFL